MTLRLFFVSYLFDANADADELFISTYAIMLNSD